MEGWPLVEGWPLCRVGRCGGLTVSKGVTVVEGWQL